MRINAVCRLEPHWQTTQTYCALGKCLLHRSSRHFLIGQQLDNLIRRLGL